MDEVLAFLKVPENRALVGWIGSGAAVVLGGLWVVIKFIATKKPGGGPSVSAKDHSIAAGRDITMGSGERRRDDAEDRG